MSRNQVYTTQIITTVYSSPTSLAPSNSSTGNSGNDSSKKNGFWGSPGKVAGTFVAVGIVCLLLLLIVIFLLYRRHKNRTSSEEDFEKRYNDAVAGPAAAGTVIATTDSDSTSSPEFVYADEKGIQGPLIASQHSSPLIAHEQNPADTPTAAGTTAAGTTAAGTTAAAAAAGGSEDPVVVDQRLDPRQMFMSQWENGGSRLSLADDVDYSRKVLRVIND